MALSWSFRRQALYYAVAAIVAVILVAATWKVFFDHAPTCGDGVQNGTEVGIDCGGACQLICANTARPPLVLWARSFESAPSTYAAAAYIENQNTLAGARGVQYTFQLFDAQNILVAERRGTIDLPPVHTIPIVESNIDAGTRTVARTLFSFSVLPVWNTISTELPVLRLTEQTLAPDASRLSANIVNDSLRDAARVTVAVVLFDSAGVARAASKTTVASLPRKSSKSLIFTWPGGVPDIVRAEMTVLPSF